jgi:hypothetical protein
VRDLFDERRSGLLTFSVIGALAALTRGFTALIRALDIAYDLTERRTWIRQRLMGVGLALGSVLMTAPRRSARVTRAGTSTFSATRARPGYARRTRDRPGIG